MDPVPAVPPGLLSVIDHVGVAVPDLDAAITLYTEVLGWQLVDREVNARQGVEEAMLAAPGDPGGAQLQLLAPLDDSSPIAQFLARSGPGLQQLAYRVDDVERVCAVLRDRGLRLLYDSSEPGSRGSRINFVHPKDTGGVLIELVEPAGGRDSMSEAGRGDQPHRARPSEPVPTAHVHAGEEPS